MTRKELYVQLDQDFGPIGIYAAESMDISQADLDAGYEHVLEIIAPALEEELIANQQLD